MPELPEVETVRRVLKKKVIDKKIQKVNIYYEKMIENDIPFFIDILEGNKFLDINRKGKYLIFELEKHYLISHLRMEGKYYYKNGVEKNSKHEHVEFIFDDNTSLIYHDTRKFGVMRIIPKEEEAIYFKNLGPEPKDIKNISMKEKVNKSKKSIKTILLDQSIMSGLGNIYVNEVLYKSKINPLKPGKEINMVEINNILLNSVEILEKSILEGGCTIKSYTSSLGVSGNYQNYLLVHMKENEYCKVCGEKIKKQKIDGRSTYYCIKCQK